MTKLEIADQAEQRPQNCGTGYCSCIECPYVAEQAEQEPVACNCGTNPWHDCDESEGCRIKKSLGISSRPVYDQRADHHKMMLGYEIATKYGVFENKAFQLCDEMKKLYAAPQPVMQEPVAWAHPSGGYLSARYMKEFATGLEKETYTIPLYAAPVQQVEQEPVATVVQSRPDTAVIDVHTGNAPLQLGTLLYASHVRTKDLTDDEIAQAVGSPLDEVYLADFRAVIAADREKNK